MPLARNCAFVARSGGHGRKNRDARIHFLADLFQDPDISCVELEGGEGGSRWVARDFHRPDRPMILSSPRKLRDVFVRLAPGHRWWLGFRRNHVGPIPAFSMVGTIDVAAWSSGWDRARPDSAGRRRSFRVQQACVARCVGSELMGGQASRSNCALCPFRRMEGLQVPTFSTAAVRWSRRYPGSESNHARGPVAISGCGRDFLRRPDVTMVTLLPSSVRRRLR